MSLARLSHFGTKLTRQTGILELMHDLGEAMAGDRGDIKMLGGGNPAHIPEVAEIFRARLFDIASDKDATARMLGAYTTPQGDRSFRQAVARFLKNEYGWKVTEKNIAVVSGSQTALFYLFNMFAGESVRGKKRILLPLVPEYIGYADQGLSEDMFVAHTPHIEIAGPHRFKYSVDFKTLRIPKEVGALCVSRPTNPTGNVLTDDEMEKLLKLARKASVPLIVDNAYGVPGPHILFTEMTPLWDEQVIHSISFSKFGLPGVRASIIVANEDTINRFASINAIVALAANNLGPELVRLLFLGGKFGSLGRDVVRPFYEKKRLQAEKCVATSFRDDLPYYLHVAEGTLFLWLWCKGLPISSRELYERLKRRGVLVVSGHYFFPGLAGRSKHTRECIRITYSQDEAVVRDGIRIIGEEVSKAYR